MKLGDNIRQYRKSAGLSQDALAESIHVSRQTISNWENNKSYPDVYNLVILSEAFDTTVDELIKGDVKAMKKKIKSEDIQSFNQWSKVYAYS